LEIEREKQMLVKQKLTILALFLFTVPDAPLAANAPVPCYTFHNLGTLGGNLSEGTAVNNMGQVAGYSYTASNIAAFLSRPNGGSLSDLGTLGGGDSSGYGINDRGQVTGNATLSDERTTHAFLSDADGGVLHDLGTLGGTQSFSYAVNAAGQVAGQA